MGAQEARGDYARRCLEMHLGIDAQSQEMRAIEVSGSLVGDAPMLPTLLQQID